MKNCLLKHSAVFCISLGLLISSVSLGAVPVAHDDMALLTEPEALLIPLTAEDDGLPDPPGALVYVITTLPQHGRLFDTVAGEITEAPYVLVDPVAQVLYEPCAYYQTGTDSFQFSVDDGGTEPDGGFSNTATISIEIDFSIKTNTGTGTVTAVYPLNTGFRKARMQAYYYPDDLGGARTLENIALNVSTVPGQVLNNWTIRMKHTTQSVFPWFGFAFDEADWTLVYDANEVITETGWHYFQLDTPFVYNGTDNLLVEFAYENETSSTSGTVLSTTVTPSGLYTARVLHQFSNTANPGVANKSNDLPNLQTMVFADVAMLAADFNYDCYVDMLDLEALAAAWLSQSGDEDYSDAVDISATDDDLINLADFAVLAGEWMQSGF